jgi:VWFA-related protein
MLIREGAMPKMNRRSFRLISTQFSTSLVALLVLAGAIVCLPLRLQAQSQQPAPVPQPTQQPDSGGPDADQGPIVVPKKKAQPEDTPPPAPVAPKIKAPEGMPPVTLHVEVPEVTVDVGVLLEKTHQFVPGLKPANFKVYEDGKEQKVIGFKRTEAPITALMICEFAATSYQFIYDMRGAAFTFVNQLRPNDYVALMTFDMHTQIVTDFTTDKRQLMESVNSLRIPGFSERNVFDALYEGLDRVSRIDGHKYIILIASGRDTFSKITLDKIYDKVKKTPDVTIFTISTGGLVRAITEGRGGFNQQLRDMDYLQADNQMKTFATMTGGLYFNPLFQGQLPDIFSQINNSIRNQYTLTYDPTNKKDDGTYRRIKVYLVDNEGKPLIMVDEKNKPLKYSVIARDGYTAKRPVE